MKADRKQHAPNPRRAELRALSVEVRAAVKAGIFPTVNAAIVALYAAEVGCTPDDFATFNDWRKAGTPVRKGERGFPVWGTPRRLSCDHTPAESAPADLTGADDGREFWPVAYLFHAGQVEAANPQQVAA